MKLFVWLTGFLLASIAINARAAEVDFVRDIRPILSDKCYACHGPDARQRQADLRFDNRRGAFADLGGHFAIVAGQPAESELIRRINSADEDEVMPPPDHTKQLSDQEKQLLASWIEQGAQWKDHWAYVVPTRYPPPEIQSQSAGLIDAFIVSRLLSRDINPAPAADRRTLLRRLSFDLTGLPPTPAEVEAFLADRSDHAYEAVVDRLLSSQHFGERMAMYWLDLVRYADTVGYHGDQDISVSPFRDYVIHAFNDNMPFDRFTREQLAGDLLPNPTRDQLVASGYNKLGMMSAEGGVQPKEYLAKYIAERVRTASSVWLGSTLGCAECHDHKFDPFTTKDFYRFAAFFADIKERGLYSGANRDGNWGPKVDVPDDKLPELLKPVDERIAALQKTIDTSTPELAAAQAAWEKEFAASDTQWQVLEPTSVTAMHDVKLKVLDDQSILASGPNPPQNTYTFTAKVPPAKITGFRLEVLPHKSLPKQGPGRASNGNFVLSEFRATLSSLDGKDQHTVALHNALATVEQTVAGDATPYGKWHAASAIDNDVKGSSWGWAILPDAGKPNELTVETTEPLTIDNQKLTITLEQNHTNGTHTLGHFRLSVTGSPPPLSPSKLKSLPDAIQQLVAIGAGERSDEQANKLSAYYRGSVAPALAETRKQLAAATAAQAKLVAEHTRSSLITVAVDPREIRVLPRGNWMDDSGEIVQPGVPHFLKQLRKADRATRADLADWITAADNPLTARVFVNRLWKLLFGSGLAKVLDDVGSQGEPPVYPELLDTLAVEFVDSRWDVKHMVKLIVMSSTYRQSSLMRDELRDQDPYNRLLARQSRFRLDAEMVRDNALAVSGLLVRQVGGRSAKPYQPAGLYRHLNFPARQYKHDTGANQYRRGLYTHWQRQFLHPAMKAFDAPAREECTAERPRSNTPLAALVLLNDPSFVEAARVFAEKAIRHGDDTQSRLDWIFAQCLSRPPSDAERAVIEQLLQSHLKQYRTQGGEAKKLVSIGLSAVPEDLDVVELAAWTSVARTILNLHETITRN